MKTLLKSLLATATLAAAGHASAQVTFYQYDNFDGASFTSQRPIDNFQRFGFNDKASSVVVQGSPWEVCDDAGFRGKCMVLRPGSYRSLRDMGMNDRLSSARAVSRDAHRSDDRYAPRPMSGQVTFYENEGFQGRSFNAEHDVNNFQRFGFNDRASSAVVLGERWEACEDANFNGRCVVLRPGRYPDLRSMGLNDRLSSVRAVTPTIRVEDARYAPMPQPAYDWRRRPDDRLHEAPVTDVRAVFAQPQQQQECWVERERVAQGGREPNVGGALIGGVLGGILGHQIGGGTGRDIATVGGAVAGAAVGSQIGPNGRSTSIQNVQKCSAVPAQGRPDYWDVTYNFRGVEHHVQATSPPGRTITVNDRGEPRL